MLVRNPQASEWGQVQSDIRGRITVNFKHVDKLVLDGTGIALTPKRDCR